MNLISTTTVADFTPQVADWNNDTASRFKKWIDNFRSLKAQMRAFDERGYFVGKRTHERWREGCKPTDPLRIAQAFPIFGQYVMGAQLTQLAKNMRAENDRLRNDLERREVFQSELEGALYGDLFGLARTARPQESSEIPTETRQIDLFS